MTQCGSGARDAITRRLLLLFAVLRNQARWVVLAVVAVVAVTLLRPWLSASPGQLAVGDCFDRPASSTPITSVQHRPCTDAHDAEVVGVFQYPATTDGAYPGRDQIYAFSESVCPPAAATYVGATLDLLTDFDVRNYRPSPEGWAAGPRVIACYVTRSDGAPLTSSVRLSMQSQPPS